MDVHPELTTFVYIAVIVVASLIVSYWVYYTRRQMKSYPHVGKTEGITIAWRRKQRAKDMF